MTEKELHKEICAMEKHVHDKESLNQIYHHIKRLLQRETGSYEQDSSIGSFLWDRLLREGR